MILHTVEVQLRVARAQLSLLTLTLNFTLTLQLNSTLLTQIFFTYFLHTLSDLVSSLPCPHIPRSKSVLVCHLDLPHLLLKLLQTCKYLPLFMLHTHASYTSLLTAPLACLNH